MAKHHETGEQTEFTEEQVRAEIIDTFQHDMGKQETDEEIAEGVNGSELDDFFESDIFEGMTYDITRV